MAEDTRTSILGAARTLFNQAGMENISLRDIADDLRISPGNLTYHFKRREDIVYELYLELVHAIDDLSAGTGEGRAESLPLQLRRGFEGVYTAFVAYRFIMDNLLQIVRTHPRIGVHYRELTKRRERETLLLFSTMVEQGWMHPEGFPDQFKLLVMQMTLMGNCFLPSAEVFLAVKEGERASLFDRMLSQLVSPYLTDAGQAEFLAASHSHRVPRIQS